LFKDYFWKLKVCIEVLQTQSGDTGHGHLILANEVNIYSTFIRSMGSCDQGLEKRVSGSYSIIAD
jgi:hypothetical protein